MEPLRCRGRAAVVLALALLAPGLPVPPSVAAACEDWVAQAISIEGSVRVRRAGEAQWVPARTDEPLCVGDMVRTDPRSRALIALREGAALRLDQGTTLTFTPQTTPEKSWIDVLVGFVYFFSQAPRRLAVLTPFVNGGVEGTEFWVEVGADRATISVYEGRVEAANARGSVTLERRQSALARAGQAPVPVPLTVTPAESVQWALHYPPVLEYLPSDFPDVPGETWPGLVRRSIEAAARPDLEDAFAALAGVPPSVADPRVPVHRAGLLLSVGRVDEAIPEIDRAQALDPAMAPAVALRSVIAVVQNRQIEALDLARRAVELDPQSATARIALSYAQQASFDLTGALQSLQEAVRLRPDSALAWARLAELRLSVGELRAGLEAAREAARLDPRQARTQTVLGFALLTQIRLPDAREAFDQAVALDPGAPLPRLGLGLAGIRAGDLGAGRREIEIAVSLDPASSLSRSYLGKAYYEEKRAPLDARQFSLAKELDPRDPTPWFYDAIRQQSENRPVEALRDLQRSIELNDNRAVYRSRLLLDEDLAARSASLARIYDDLGFRQLALVEGWKSVNTDPANYSSHRFLADSYGALPRHEVARVSEILQSQLLQPLVVQPVPPFLALDKSFILAGTGPSTAGLNEFNSLFERNRLSLRASGVVGGNDTFGDEVVASGLWNRMAASLGQFHYETDGFRPNNDLKFDIYNVFAQGALTADTSLQAEYRRTVRKSGDLPLRFDPTNFEPSLRENLQSDSVRVGLRQRLTPSALLIGSFLYERGDLETTLFGRQRTTVQDSYNPELQYLLRTEPLSLVGGAGYYTAYAEDSILGDSDTRFGNAYAYAQIRPAKTVAFTLGLGVDSLSSDVDDITQPNPKLGVVCNPFPETTLRAAVFRTLGRPLVAGQSIEPTQVAGFNQLYDDAGVGTDTWRYGIAVDQRLPGHVYAGAEFAHRDMDVPFVGFDFTTGTEAILRADWKEDLARAYVYWAPTSRVALSAEYLYERLERPPEFPGSAEVVESRTHRIPLGVAYFDPSGLTARVQATYVYQNGRFGDFSRGVVSGSDRFWLLDVSISYRLPRRWGLITIEARNLVNQDLRFNDTDSTTPTIYPERLIMARFTVAY